MTVSASGQRALPTPPQADAKRPVTPPPAYQAPGKTPEDAFEAGPENFIPGAFDWVKPPTTLPPRKAAAAAPPPPPPTPMATILKEALSRANAALDGDIKATEKELEAMRAKLPWFAGRLGRGVGRVVLPLAVAASVAFAVMALPLLALLAGCISGLVTWLVLREQDPDQTQVTEVLENKQRPASAPAPEPVVKRPRLQAEKLTVKLAALKRCRADVIELQRKKEMHDNEAALSAVQKTHLTLTQDLQSLEVRIKPLDEAAGSGTWRKAAKNAGGAVAAAFVLSHAYGFAELPFGGFWRAANSAWLKPLVLLTAALYGKEATANVLVNLDHKHRILADALEILKAEREALIRGKAIYVDMIWQAQGKPSLWQRMKKAFLGESLAKPAPKA